MDKLRQYGKPLHYQALFPRRLSWSLALSIDCAVNTAASVLNSWGRPVRFLKSLRHVKLHPEDFWCSLGFAASSLIESSLCETQQWVYSKGKKGLGIRQVPGQILVWSPPQQTMTCCSQESEHLAPVLALPRPSGCLGQISYIFGSSASWSGMLGW